MDGADGVVCGTVSCVSGVGVGVDVKVDDDVVVDAAIAVLGSFIVDASRTDDTAVAMIA